MKKKVKKRPLPKPVQVSTRRVSKTLYEKRGSKYIPVGKDDFILPHGFGDYIVRVRHSGSTCRMYKKALTVDYARLEVLLAEAAECLCDAIYKVSEAEPKSRPWTDRENKAWEAYKRIAGTENLSFSRGSCHDMSLRASEVLRDRLRKRIANGGDVVECPEGCTDVWADKEL